MQGGCRSRRCGSRAPQWCRRIATSRCVRRARAGVNNWRRPSRSGERLRYSAAPVSPHLLIVGRLRLRNACGHNAQADQVFNLSDFGKNADNPEGPDDYVGSCTVVMPPENPSGVAGPVETKTAGAVAGRGSLWWNDCILVPNSYPTNASEKKCAGADICRKFVIRHGLMPGRELTAFRCPWLRPGIRLGAVRD